MKILENFVLQKIADEHIVVPIGEAADKLHGVIKLSSTGVFLWKNLIESKTQDELVDILSSEYQIERGIAQADVQKFIKQLVEMGCIEQ